MTNDYFAQKRGYTQFLTDGATAYVDNEEFPNATTLDLLREDAYAIIFQYVNGTPASTENNRLRLLEYHLVERMIDDILARTTTQNRGQFVPKGDYLYQRERDYLVVIGSDSYNFGVGGA